MTLNDGINLAVAALTLAGIVGGIGLGIVKLISNRMQTLIQAHEKVVGEAQSDLGDKVDGINTRLDKLNGRVGAGEVAHTAHGERLAWLEGKANKPLGSMGRDP